EDETVLADLQLVAVLERLGRLDPAAVQECAVQAAEILDREPPALVDQHGVVPGDRDVVEENVAFGRAPDRRALPRRGEVLPCPASTRTDDERRALEFLERERAVVVDLVVGAEGHRRFGVLLVGHEERAALRAVVRSLRVLEAALRTVDVAHRGRSRSGVATPPRRWGSPGPCPPGWWTASPRRRPASPPPSSAASRRARRAAGRSFRAEGAAGRRSRSPGARSRGSGF